MSSHRRPRRITREQARELDRRAENVYGMSSLVLMENAGRGLAEQFLSLQLRGPVIVCCGTGNNGGDGFVMARHLDLRGVDVQVFLWGDRERFTPDARVNCEILERSKIAIEVCGSEPATDRLAAALARAGCMVDALLGTGARGQPRAPLDAVIDTVNAHRLPRLAVDIPSGLDCDTGLPATSTVRATHTCTFVAEKIGFASQAARSYLGLVHVLDIGAPRVLVESVLRASH